MGDKNLNYNTLCLRITLSTVPRRRTKETMIINIVINIDTETTIY